MSKQQAQPPQPVTLADARDLLRAGNRDKLAERSPEELWALLREVRSALVADRLAVQRASEQDLAGATDADLKAHANATGLLSAKIQRGVFEERAIEKAYERARHREDQADAREFAATAETALPPLLDWHEKAARDFASAGGELAAFVQQLLEPIVWEHLTSDPLADRTLSDRLAAALGPGDLQDRLLRRQVNVAQFPSIEQRQNDWVVLGLDKVQTRAQLAAWQAAVPGAFKQVPAGSTAARQLNELLRDLKVTAARR